MIEDVVKKELEIWEDIDKGYISRHSYDDLAYGLCHLFPKTEENPGGYEPKPDMGISCPFCNGWDDCDKPGLKHHLTYCEVYKETKNV